MQRFNCSLQETLDSCRTDGAVALVSLFSLLYLLPFNVTLLARAGVPAMSAYTATVLATGLGTLLFSVAGGSCLPAGPAASVNLYLAYTLILSQGCSLAEAMGIVVLAGLLLFFCCRLGWLTKLFAALPPGLQVALRVGIGLWLLLTGAELGHLIVPSTITATALGDFADPVAFLSLLGLLVSLGLWQYNYRLAVGTGMLAVAAGACGLSLPDWPQTFFAVPDYPVQCGSLVFLTRLELVVPVLVVLLLLWAENTSCLQAAHGCQVAVLTDKSIQAKTNDNAMLQLAACSAVLSACLGAGAVAAAPTALPGVLAGGKRNTISLWVVLYLLVLLFCAPLAEVLQQCSYIAAPALLLTGCCLVREIRLLDWQNTAESIAAVLLAVFMALGSLTGGLCLGLLVYCLLKVMAGEGSSVPRLTYLLAALLAAQLFIYPG